MTLTRATMVITATDIVASGIVNAGYRIGSALGLGAMTAVAPSSTDLTDGISAAFVGAAGIAVVGALISAVTLRGTRSASDAVECEAVPV